MATRSQSWDYDALGNFDSQTTDGTTQMRSANKLNEITSISGLTTPAYDGNGNTTTDQVGKTLVYDAWNRLVAYKNGMTTLVAHQYDGLNRRVVEHAGTATDLYYSSGWQVLEERQGGTVKTQYVWSPVYVDALVERDRDADANSGNGLEERLYAQQDANYNVTALVDTSGAVQERYAYDSYGQPSYFDASYGSRTSSSYAASYLFQGGRYEGTSGMYHLRNRELSPNLGRWTSLDPLGFDAGDRNFYRALDNNPANRSDPTGNQPQAPDAGFGQVSADFKSEERSIRVTLDRNLGTVPVKFRVEALTPRAGILFAGAQMDPVPSTKGFATNQNLQGTTEKAGGFTGRITVFFQAKFPLCHRSRIKQPLTLVPDPRPMVTADQKVTSLTFAVEDYTFPEGPD